MKIIITYKQVLNVYREKRGKEHILYGQILWTNQFFYIMSNVSLKTYSKEMGNINEKI